jgi:predicted aldo/keto reductase-like oxidoreductase
MVIMEPVMGGRLADPPDPIQQIWDGASKRRSPADLALQWVWNQPEVAIALSGMSTMQQVEENVASAASSGVGSLSAEELALFEQVRTKYKDLCPIPCTRCDYCMPCPNGVHIPFNFAIYNDGIVYNKPDHARDEYNNRMPKEARASVCTRCHECEDKCPQSIPISEWMVVIHQVLGEGKPCVCTLPTTAPKEANT